MSAVNDLVKQISNKELRESIMKEVKHLLHSKKFGLVFERHLPEIFSIPDFPVIKGERVARKNKSFDDVFDVEEVNGNDVEMRSIQKTDDQIPEKESKENLVVVRFNDAPIYPYLKHEERIQHKDSSIAQPSHVLIESDNFHALKVMQCFGENSVDCIYIDPPYNTGATTWKYNNDYVGETDEYRYSKWLSMMEKRLIIAKSLLKKDGVIMIAIDDHEYPRLLLLAEQTFGKTRYNFFTIIHKTTANPKARGGIVRRHEYTIVIIPNKKILGIIKYKEKTWQKGNRSSSTGNYRQKRKQQFYPILYCVENNEYKIIGVGEYLPLDKNPTAKSKDGVMLLWPPENKKGRYLIWRYGIDTMKKELDRGNVRIRDFPKNSKKIKRKPGLEIFAKKTEVEPISSIFINNTQFTSKGTASLNDMLPEDTEFEYPKSPYLVYSLINAALHDKENATVLDFFAGSGTTLESVCLINSKNEKNHRCILVSNNEKDIFDNVTVARTFAVITGKKRNGEDTSGEWKIGESLYKEIVSSANNKNKKKNQDSDEDTEEENSEEDFRLLKMKGFPDQQADVFSLKFSSETEALLNRHPERLANLLWLRNEYQGEPPSALECKKNLQNKGFYIKDSLVMIYDFSKIESVVKIVEEGVPLYYVGPSSTFDNLQNSLSRSVSNRLINAVEIYHDIFSMKSGY